jgi:hypothetical protein
MDWSPEELQRMHDERLTRRASLGDIPLIVLARASGGYEAGPKIPADSLEQERRQFAADLAALSSAGQQVFAKRAGHNIHGHNIHIEEPDLVVTAIRHVVERSRANKRTIGAIEPHGGMARLLHAR